MMGRIKKLFIAALCLTLCVLAAFSVNLNGRTAVYAATPVGGEDGTYNVSYEFGGQSGIGGQMLSRYFSQTAVVEKLGERYYLSVTQLSSSMQNLSLNLESGKQVGYRITEDDGSKKTYSFTLSEENLKKALPFSVFVSVRGETFDFTVTLNLASATKTGEFANPSVERPAEFVPVIVTNAGSEYEAVKGQTFVIPEASASLGEENVAVKTSAYYVRGGVKTDVALDGNKFVLNNAGEYHVVYRAESSAYTTSLGNPTFAEKDVKIISSIVGDGLAKLYDENGVLPSGTSLLASRIQPDSAVYKTAALKMKTVADKFQVFGVELVSADGSSVTPSGKVTVGIKADYTYNRNSVEAYLLEENGELTKLNVSNGGSYVNVQTSKGGTIIVCVPGVAFHMPVWGYILILVGAVLVVAAAIVTVIVVVKRKKKQAKAG